MNQEIFAGPANAVAGALMYMKGQFMYKHNRPCSDYQRLYTNHEGYMRFGLFGYEQEESSKIAEDESHE